MVSLHVEAEVSPLVGNPLITVTHECKKEEFASLKSLNCQSVDELSVDVDTQQLVLGQQKVDLELRMKGSMQYFLVFDLAGGQSLRR